MTKSEDLFFDNYSLEVLPFVCRQIINGKDYTDFVKKYVSKLKKNVYEQKNNLYEQSQNIDWYCINPEERKIIKKLQELRDAQLTFYCRALYKLEQFIRKPKPVLVAVALNYCIESEKIWKRIITEMCGFVVLNLQSKGLRRIF